MTITCGVFNTGANLHGTPQVPPWEFSRTAQTFFGVVGEYNLFGKAHSRYITCWLLLTGYSSHFNLQTAVADMATLMGEFGELEFDLGGGDVTVFTQCIFEGFDPSDEAPWLDGSGVHGWQYRGTLKFRQIAQE